MSSTSLALIYAGTDTRACIKYIPITVARRRKRMIIRNHVYNEVLLAFAVLSDSRLRAKYDASTEYDVKALAVEVRADEDSQLCCKREALAHL